MSTTTPKRAPSSQQTVAARKSIANQRRATAPSARVALTRDRIEARAYEIFQTRQRNAGPGDAMSDWLQAERELNGPAPSPAAAVEIRTRARGDRSLAGGK